MSTHESVLVSCVILDETQFNDILNIILKVWNLHLMVNDPNAWNVTHIKYPKQSV